MADDAVLGDLCSICNTTKFKYRCPGCDARTCSLPCYKRHQQWVQCDGKRDPTKFVKKSDLVTPAGIDHDFNFLTGIERGVEKAERNVEKTAASTVSDPRQGAHSRSATDYQLAATGVSVIRAPKGLSRQKENKTHCTKKGKMSWTIEWIRDDNTRVLNQGSGSVPLLQLLPFKPEVSTKKRKFHAEKHSASTPSADHDASTPTLDEEGESRVQDKVKKARLPTPEQPRIGHNDTNTSPQRDDSHNTKMANHDAPSSPLHGSSPESLPPKYSFFLLRPRTSSSRRVLIPLDPLHTLGDCLRDRTVLEFPTIHVFPSTNAPPSEAFMYEAEYIKQEGEEHKEFEDLLKHASPETLRALRNEQEDDKTGEELDSRKILDVLKQDIGVEL